MDWNDFRYFLALKSERTLAAAARDLGVEHSTVSRRLAALEEALKARLFTRTPEGFVLTQAGKDIAGLTEDLQRTISSIERKVRGGDEVIEGTVRITTSEGFTAFLIKRLAALRERYPGLVAEVLSGNESLDLLRGQADVAVRFKRTTQPDLLCKKIGTTGWSLYAAESYLARSGAPASSRDLAGHDLVGFDEAMSGTPGAQWLSQHGQGANVVLRGNSILSVLNATLVGMGVAALPCFMADAEGSLRRISNEVIGAREICLVVHPDMAGMARVRAVLDFL
ncbi:MAG TPA: LysR family transcriptional regulator, partial [Polyangiaceae bacterium]|nr:LysR family transcriptional regulator [Polyangiaceae bacterium]